MLKNWQYLVDQAKTLGRVTVSVAAAQDHEVLEALKAAYDLGMVDAILVGDEAAIRPMAAEVGLPADVRIVNETDLDKAALKAASLVRNGEAQILMKGIINSSNFLRGALNAECGLRSGRQLSHFVGSEIPGAEKLLFHTDGGMNVAPGLAEKKQILTNAIEALNALGVQKPYVAALTANEQVNPKIPSTVDADGLVQAVKAGEIPECVIEGPIALDVAVSPEAAHHKGIKSEVSGKVDIFLFPSIEAGNVLGKSLAFYAKAKNAGVILGATHPIVMTSRSDSAEAKTNSIAMACCLVKR
ncbi:phosphate acyltransferase [Holophaga foetida]|uniref:phosphate acyltransferase n=1 Tax=Holophaga foetida TaxID=35839 RepID=UPI0002473EBA|nr:phosphate acyltransferase [Holophaga foetida]